MTLYEFNLLSFEEKQATIWEYGEFIENHITSFGELEIINLYAINIFYVELVYDQNANKIKEVRSFKTGKDLEKYLPKINIVF